MSKRQSISKKIRFEVFKRDKFTCQYCGRMSPDVVLEVDHIKPVSKGGTNDIMNLITSCMECNRGKSNRELSDDSVIKKQQAQLQELADRKEQLEMMLKWRKSLKELDNDIVNAVEEAVVSCSGFGLTESGRESVKKWVKEFSLNEVLDAVEISFDYYYDTSEDSWEIAFRKIPGICNVKRRERDNPTLYYENYTIKALKNKGFYCDDAKIRRYIRENVTDDDTFEVLKQVIKASRNWTIFKRKATEQIGGLF